MNLQTFHIQIHPDVKSPGIHPIYNFALGVKATKLRITKFSGFGLLKNQISVNGNTLMIHL